ncbi:hypothetical protein [Acrocarpospora pleiomorpha]|uniref:hypothetical protein n=1 Tax=Acrocarpospora pleiomorpha TaxID=90975 RepID=UPI0012D2B76A|nr:hypothetical protein [Acrocarpospora pleiomorpha]
MGKLIQAACAGAMLIGVVGCSAEAQTGSPSGSPSPSASLPTPTASLSVIPRQNIRVVVDPTSIAGGATKNVRVTAFCPPAQPGTTYKANARSDAFTGVVSLMPPVVATPAAATMAATEPRLTGVALLNPNAKAGGYRVEVRCEATNDVGSARFRVTAPPADTFPTKAPGAGGGGTAAGGPEESSGLPITPITLGLLTAFFVGIGVARRRNRG